MALVSKPTKLLIKPYYHLECNHLGWVHTLPHVCFNMMKMVNKSKGLTPCQLWLSRSPRIIPLLVPTKSSDTVTDIDAWHVIWHLETDVLKDQDNLIKAKISRYFQMNNQCVLKFPFSIGSCVWLSTLHPLKGHMAKGKRHVAKFMPCYHGPYTIIGIDKGHLTVMLDLPNSANTYPPVHTSEILPYLEFNISHSPPAVLKNLNWL